MEDFTQENFTVTTTLTQSDGRIYLGGFFKNKINNIEEWSVRRILRTGEIDPYWNQGYHTSKYYQTLTNQKSKFVTSLYYDDTSQKIYSSGYQYDSSVITVKIPLYNQLDLSNNSLSVNSVYIDTSNNPSPLYTLNLNQPTRFESAMVLSDNLKINWQDGDETISVPSILEKHLTLEFI